MQESKFFEQSKGKKILVGPEKKIEVVESKGVILTKKEAQDERKKRLETDSWRERE